MPAVSLTSHHHSGADPPHPRGLVHGDRRRHARTDGESRLVARSGLRFAPLTLAQRTALATTLQNLATAHQPIA